MRPRREEESPDTATSSEADGSEQTIRLRDGRRLGYAEWGDPAGQPLLFFHGWPGSRVEGRLGDEAARETGVRLIAVDRPGMGLSDFQPRRTLVDWPDDIVALAEALGLDRFAVLGISGGGPYAAACAWKLSDRLSPAGIVSSLAPLDVPGAVSGMGRRNRLSFQLVGRVGVLRRGLFAAIEVSVRRRWEAWACLGDGALRSAVGISGRGDPDACLPLARRAGRKRSDHLRNASDRLSARIPRTPSRSR